MPQRKLLINSEEYPGATLREGQFIPQSIGSKLELLALTDVSYVVYWFNEPPLICKQHYQEILQQSESPLAYILSVMTQCITNLMRDIYDCLGEQIPCGASTDLECQELIYLVTCYYPSPQLSRFFYPINNYTESSQYFVMQNYEKAKNVEEFAHLGGYTTTTLRRLSKDTYRVPVYEWIPSKKREGTLEDLQHTKQRITEVNNRYSFDSLSHFAHFCEASFRDSLRTLHTCTAEGEKITTLETEWKPSSAWQKRNGPLFSIHNKQTSCSNTLLYTRTIAITIELYKHPLP